MFSPLFCRVNIGTHKNIKIIIIIRIAIVGRSVLVHLVDVVVVVDYDEGDGGYDGKNATFFFAVSILIRQKNTLIIIIIIEFVGGSVSV